MDLFGCRRPRLISVQLPVAIIIIHTLTLQQVVVDLAKRFISKVISRKSAAINCYFSAVVFALLALFVCHPTFAQVDRCSRDIPHLSANERITYKAYYNWKFIWLRAADILFTSNDTSYNNVPAHHFLAEGRSLKEYDLFFKVRDRFESIVAKEGFRPLYFIRDTYEGGYKAFNKYIYNYTGSSLYMETQTSERPFRIDIKPEKTCTFDVLSAIHYCRGLDFSSHSKGDIIPFAIAIDNEVFELYIRYQGRERLELRDGRIYNTVKFSVKLVEGTVFKGGEDMVVWASDDPGHVPIMVEAKILIGSVKAILSTAENLAFPLLFEKK